MLQDLLDQMRSNGFYDITPEFNGTIQRFSRDGKTKKNCWFVGYTICNENFKDPFYIAIYGDWSTNERYEFRSIKRLNERQKQDFERFKKEAEDKRLAQQIEIHAKAKSAAQNYFKTLSKLENPTEYLARKKCRTVENLYLDQDSNSLVVPMYHDFLGTEIVSYQEIYNDGKKMFQPGCPLKGALFPIWGESSTVYLCEGLATAISVFMATQKTVVVFFNANNCRTVAKKAVENFPKAEIIICTDNDKYKAHAGNTGYKEASKAAQELNLKVCIPEFQDSSTFPTDFNDLHCLEGLEVVKTQIERAQDPENIEYRGKNYSILYSDFVPFFDKHLEGAINEKFTRDLIIRKGKEYYSVYNKIGQIRSLAVSNGLSRSYVEDHLNRYHSEIEPRLLIDIPEWDGVDRILEFFLRLKITNIEHDLAFELFQEYCSNIFKRVENETNQNFFLIFRGKQGIGKDTWIKSLFNDAFSNFYYSNVRLSKNQKENYQTIFGKILCNIPEFDSTNDVDIADLKDLITTDSVYFRSPYSKKPERVTFHVSFISSCNFEEILKDTSGNRRFMIFDIDKIDFSYDKFINGPQILAQINHLYQQDFKASKTAHKKMKDIIDRETPMSWKDFLKDEIFDLFKKKEFSSMGRKVFTHAEVMPLVHDLATRYRVKPNAILQLMKGLGYARKDREGMVYGENVWNWRDNVEH